MHKIMLTKKGAEKHNIPFGQGLTAVPVAADYPGEMLVIAHQVVAGVNSGLIISVGDYVICGDGAQEKRELTIPEANALVGEVTKMIIDWEDKPYSDSPDDDCMKFARELITYFHTKL